MTVNFRYWARRALPYALSAGFVGSLALGAIGNASALSFHLAAPADYSGSVSSGNGSNLDDYYYGGAAAIIILGALGAFLFLRMRKSKGEKADDGTAADGNADMGGAPPGPQTFEDDHPSFDESSPEGSHGADEMSSSPPGSPPQ